MVTKNDQETKRFEKYRKENLQNVSDLLEDKLSIHSINRHWALTMIQGLRYKDKRELDPAIFRSLRTH